MKILIIGNGDSKYVFSYIENVLLPNNHDVYLISPEITNLKYKEFYIRNEVKQFNVNSSMLKRIKNSKVRKIYIVLIQIIALKKQNFDFIHIHYVNIYKFGIANFIKKARTKIIVSFWGSDLLRASNMQLQKIGFFLNNVYAITYSGANSENRIIENYGGKYIERMKDIKFGVDIFSLIDQVLENNDTENVTKELDIDLTKIVITIGYNGAEQQQHLKILEALKELNTEEKNKILIVIPLTYGLKDSKYQESILCATKEIGCQYKILENYLSDYQIAQIRCVTDIFIHGQTTDMFSASVQENLYSGATVINGKWLEYSDLKKSEIRYYEFEKFSQIGTILRKCLNNKKNLDGQDKKENIEKLKKMSSWKAVAEQWNSLYEKKEF